MAYLVSLSLNLNPLSCALALLAALAALAAALVAHTLASRPPLPRAAPPLLEGWPVVGRLDFFRARADFVMRLVKQTPGGLFTFYCGPHPVVALSGPEARAAFFNSRGLSLNEGYSNLFAGMPDIDFMSDGGSSTSEFVMCLKRLVQRDRLADNLARMTADAHAALADFASSTVIDPFAVMLRLVHQLTHRGVGSHDVADDPRLMADILACFGNLSGSSASEIIFPNVPWPSKLRKMWAGLRLHWIFSRIVKDRRRTGRREPDGMQLLMDQGLSEVSITAFIIATLFAGLVNSTFDSAWVLAYLTENRDWYARIQAEVDDVLAAHRRTADEPVADIIARLPLDAWETKFPLIDLALRETIRHGSQLVMMRANVTGKHLEIGTKGQVIPKGGYAVYATEDIHMDEKVYADPTAWDPSRYLPGREEDKKQPNTYVGWGTGLHPCLGMKFAKLEITVAIVTFFAHYNYERCDKSGNKPVDELPQVDRSGLGEKHPVRDIFLKLTRRV